MTRNDISDMKPSYWSLGERKPERRIAARGETIIAVGYSTGGEFLSRRSKVYKGKSGGGKA